MMDDKKKMVPRIRFRGFGDAWEQRKLNDFLIESQIKGSNGSTSQKLTVKLWGKGIVPKVNNWKKGSENTKYYVRHAGQLMYGKLDFLHGAFGIVPKSLDGFESTVDSPAFDISKKINSSFLLYLVMQRKFYIKQGSIANGSRKAKRVHENTFLDMSIQLPKVEEQGKIGQLLGTIDNLIVANEKKGQQLKGLKRLLMEKIFSQVWRFRGFSDPWEQRKLGQLYKKSKCKNDLSYDSNQTISVATMSWSSSNVDSSDAYMKTYNIFKKGDIAFEGHKSNEYKFGRFVLNNLGDGIVSHIFDVFNPITPGDQNFWSYFIHNDQQMHQILAKSTTQATMMNSLVARDFMKQSINVPKYEEQAQIGGLLKSIDNLIVANEKKLDQLKQLKKYLMQNMFV